MLTLVYLECIPVGKGAALAQSLDGAQLLLRAGKVSRLKRLAELLQIGGALLKYACAPGKSSLSKRLLLT
jgi:hypothetical protein